MRAFSGAGIIRQKLEFIALLSDDGLFPQAHEPFGSVRGKNLPEKHYLGYRCSGRGAGKARWMSFALTTGRHVNARYTPSTITKLDAKLYVTMR